MMASEHRVHIPMFVFIGMLVATHRTSVESNTFNYSLSSKRQRN